LPAQPSSDFLGIFSPYSCLGRRYNETRRVYTRMKTTIRKRNQHVFLLTASCLCLSSCICLSSRNFLRLSALKSYFAFWNLALSMPCLSLFLMLICRAFPSLALLDIPLDNTHKDRNTPRYLKTKAKAKGRRDENLKSRKNAKSIYPCLLSWVMYVIGSSLI
jgi:hypothetical protein